MVVAGALLIATLMHDPTYRLGVARQNVSYNQPAAHTGSFLGAEMRPPKRPAIAIVPSAR